MERILILIYSKVIARARAVVSTIGSVGAGVKRFAASAAGYCRVILLLVLLFLFGFFVSGT